MDFTITLISLVIIVVIGAVALSIARAMLHAQAAQHYEHDIFRISIPQYASLKSAGDTDYRIQERLAQVESIFSNLAFMKAERGIYAFLYGRRDHFSLEIVLEHGLVHFYAAMPKELTHIFMQQVHAVYPQANFEPVRDYNIFQPHASILGAYLTFRRTHALPLNTYRHTTADPLEGVLSTLTKMPSNSGAAIQFVLRSSKRNWRDAGRKISDEVLHKGKPLSKALRDSYAAQGYTATIIRVLGQILSLVGATFMPSSKPKDPTMPTHQPSAQDIEVIKAIQDKMNKAAFDATVRVVVSTVNRQQAELHLRDIMNSFGQYNSYESGNALQSRVIGNQNSIIRKFIYRQFEERAAIVVNAEEVVSMFHLPEHIQIPNIAWLQAKKVPPPNQLPSDGVILGYTSYRGEHQEVRIQDADRRRHVYVIGQTGVGKSVLMENMAIQDIHRGKGVCFIDPHGDAIEKILTHIPAERAEDVILFDPSDTERPMALNMLEFATPDQKTFVINEMINIFDKLYDLRQTGGPMFEQYMRNTMLLMMEDPDSGSTLLEIPKVLSDEKFRKYKLSKANNPVVRDFWEKEAQKAGGEAALANMVPYITSKLTQFVANDIMRPIISQQKSSFNFRTCMDKQQILLINLSKGKIGDMNSALLGMVIVGKILMAALSRVDMPEEQRSDYYLYIDEFQNFITDSISIILSEARKYKLNLTMAHQYIGQLVKNNNPGVRDAVFGNVGTMVSFRVGVEDAEQIAKQFTPVVDTYDVMNVEKYNFYIRLLYNNQNLPAFSCVGVRPSPGDPILARQIKELSRNSYGRPRQEVEREIFERTKLPASAERPLPPVL